MTEAEIGPTRSSLFWLWLAVTAVGTVLPLSQLLPWLAEHGIAPALFFADLFANRGGGAFGWDVIVSAFAVIIFVLIEGKRSRVPHQWLPIAATLLVGVSCGLPLFLALRERALARW